MASFYDTFVRANNPAAIGTADSGPVWSNIGGTMGILSNQVYNPSGALAHSVVDLGVSDCVVRWQVSVTQNATAILVRCTDVNNLYYIRNNNGTNYALSKLVSGVFTQLITGGHPANGDYLTVVCSGSTIKLYVNGALAFTYSDAFNQNATKFGVRCSDVNSRYSGMASQALPSGVASWYITNAGTWFGDGSLALPWDWRTGLNGSVGIVRPLDTLWVRGGVHLNSGDPEVVCLLGDGSTNYVDVKRYPGDGWAKIRTGLYNMTTQGSPGGVRYWYIQIAQNNIARINNYRGDNPNYGWGGIILEAPNTKFIGCINANNAGNAGGWFYGEQALNAKVFMCMTYFNGFCDLFNGLPSGQGFYRQADDAGTGNYQFIDTSITCFNYQSGMQIYGSGAANLNHARTDRSLFFFGGFLGASYAGGQAIREVLLGSTSDFVKSDKIYFDQDWIWPADSSIQGVQLGYNGHDNTFTSMTNCQIRGRFSLHYFRQLEFSGNTVTMPVFNSKVDEIISSALIGAPPSPTGLGIDRNTWYQSNDGAAGVGHRPFQYDNGTLNQEYLTPATFYSALGYEQHSTLAAYGAQPSVAAAYPNTEDPTALAPAPRGFIYVFNYQGLSSIDVDLSACLTVGKPFSLYDWGQYELDSPTPIKTAVYGGGSVTIPLGIQTLPTIVADQTARAKHDIPPTLDVGSGAVPGAYYVVQLPSTDQVTVLCNDSQPGALWPVPRAYIYLSSPDPTGLGFISVPAPPCLQKKNRYVIYDWTHYANGHLTAVCAGVYDGSGSFILDMPKIYLDLPDLIITNQSALPTPPGNYVLCVTATIDGS